MNDRQRQIARKLVELLLEAGCTISVWRDEDYEIKLSHDIDDILAAMGKGLMDTLEIDKLPSTKHDNPYQGDIYLIFQDETVVIDNAIVRSAIPTIQPIIDQVKDFAASLAGEQS